MRNGRLVCEALPDQSSSEVLQVGARVRACVQPLRKLEIFVRDGDQATSQKRQSNRHIKFALVFSGDEPVNSFPGDLIVSLTKLLEKSHVDLASQLRPSLVEMLHDLLRHDKWSTKAISALNGNGKDAMDDRANLVVGRYKRQGRIRRIAESCLELGNVKLIVKSTDG